MENKTRQLVTAGPIAEATHQARSTVYRLARDGKIPSYRAGLLGRGVRFDLVEVLEALRREVADRPTAK